MPQLTYDASNFPASYGSLLAGPHSLSFTWPDLLWAAISVGRGELAHLFRYGPFSNFEIIYRAAVIFANLCDTSNGAIRRSAAYDGLDPSEKGAISYFVGLTITKLFVGMQLDVPWLMHVDVYRQQLQLVHGSSRPDLVGRNVAGDWIVVESKGRSRGHDKKALLRAKTQAQQVVSIGGAQPALRLALVAHFQDDLLQCSVDDPDDNGPREKRIELPLSEKDLLEGYYRPFREWLRDAPNIRHEVIEQQSFRVADFPEIDVSVGLSEDVLDETELPLRRSPRVMGDHRSVGIDGILVETGELWSRENMAREPQERRRSR